MTEETKETEEKTLFDECKGRDVIKVLARKYHQLYLIPGEEGERLYPDVVNGGIEPFEMPYLKDLSHFRTTDGDSLCYEDTPAGKVCTVTLCDRGDFEIFLQIMGWKCKKEQIPPTQNAVFIGEKNGGPLIVLTVGPYSGISAEHAGFPEDEWNRISQDIRRFHECTHFIMRSMFPDKIDIIWDEIVADAVGLYAATGKYDGELAKAFFGIKGDTYEGGRLGNYVPSKVEDKEGFISKRVPRLLRAVEKIAKETETQTSGPFEYALHLQEQKFLFWDLFLF